MLLMIKTKANKANAENVISSPFFLLIFQFAYLDCIKSLGIPMILKISYSFDPMNLFSLLHRLLG